MIALDLPNLIYYSFYHCTGCCSIQFFVFLEINMTSKKRSPFYVFLSSHRRDEINEGNKAPSLKELAIQLSPKWNVSNL